MVWLVKNQFEALNIQCNNRCGDHMSRTVCFNLPGAIYNCSILVQVHHFVWDSHVMNARFLFVGKIRVWYLQCNILYLFVMYCEASNHLHGVSQILEQNNGHYIIWFVCRNKFVQLQIKCIRVLDSWNQPPWWRECGNVDLSSMSKRTSNLGSTILQHIRYDTVNHGCNFFFQL